MARPERIRKGLGDGYLEALRRNWSDRIDLETRRTTIDTPPYVLDIAPLPGTTVNEAARAVVVVPGPPGNVDRGNHPPTGDLAGGDLGLSEGSRRGRR